MNVRSWDCIQTRDIVLMQIIAPFTLYNLTGLGTVPSPAWCNVNASDRARPTQMSCGPGPPRGGGLGSAQIDGARPGMICSVNRSPCSAHL